MANIYNSQRRDASVVDSSVKFTAASYNHINDTENVEDTFLKFKNVGGFLKLQLYGKDVTVKSITLTGNNGEMIAGEATITGDYDGAPIATMADNTTTSITLNCGEKGVKIGATPKRATAFWLVVPPTTFEKGFTIKVKDVDGKVMIFE